MKRLTILLLAVAMLAIACDSIARKQSSIGDAPVEETNAISEPALTMTTEPANRPGPTAEPAAIQTAQQLVDQPATNTRVPTPTPEATQEPAPTAAKIDPHPGAPECSGHDETRWHGLWNADAGCHYDHTHNADPFATEFAERVAAWDQTISYPWQTSHENTMKHEGYKYTYSSDPDCTRRRHEEDNCVLASLIELHALGSQLEITTRFHSFRAIALISEGPNDEPGTIELGGHSDFGILHCPYKREHCPLPSDPPGSNFDGMRFHPPYRASEVSGGVKPELADGMIKHSWNSGWQPVVREFYPEAYNLLFEYDFQTADAWGALNPDNPTEVHLVCPEGNCPFNNSTLRVYEIVIRVPEELAGPDGRVNFTGFTDVQGNIDGNCTEAGPNCVPLIIENAPAGSATFHLPVGKVPLAAYPDYDVYFDGVTSGWIQYPN